MFIAISLLIIPASADALIWFKGTSQPGELTTSTALLIPFPIINTTITESGVSDLFGIAQFTISEHDDTNNYNTLQISTDAGDAIKLPVPYGSLGLNYRLVPKAFPPLAVDQSDFYGYLSVDNGSVTGTITIATDFSLTIERDQLIEFITPFLPDLEVFEQFIGAGPFDLGFSLHGELSGKATLTHPTISGNFDYLIDLPEDIFTQEIPTDIPLPDQYQGSLSIEATCNWDNWSFLSPFASVSLSLVHSFQGEEHLFDPINFDFLPRGTFILWFDR